jgi:hypothetical protein
VVAADLNSTLFVKKSFILWRFILCVFCLLDYICFLLDVVISMVR